MPSPRRLLALAAVGLVIAASCADPTSPPSQEEPTSQPVGPDGGTASASDGSASLSVPAGALPDTVEITVSAAEVTDMISLVPNEEYDADLGTVYGVTPIEGTMWDLQPDGLQFLTPATIVLRYEDSALPEGVSEEELAVFVLDGSFERLPSTVDPEANTLTAEIEHFTFAFTGVDSGQILDLELASLSASSQPGVGETVAVTAEVRNGGPGVADGARVLYEVQGNVALGEVHASCSEEPAPGFGDLAFRCSLPPLPADESASAPPVRLVPQEAGTTVTVRATAVAAVEDTDPNPENDSDDLQIVVVGEGAVVDLKAGQPRLSSESDARVGGLMAFIGRVDNLGPGASSGGTMLFEAMGDVELGDVPEACQVMEAAEPVTAAIECPVDPLEPFGIDAVGPMRLTAASAGEVEVVTTVTSAPDDTDVDPENDVNRLTVEVASTFLVDLEPVAPGDLRGAFLPDSTLTFQVRVGNYLPPSNGGTILYEAIGDVALGEVAEGCTEISSPSGVAVICPFDAFVGYVNDTKGPNGETIRGWVGPFRFVPQSSGVIALVATTVPVDGDTDVNPENDRYERQIEIVDGSAADPAPEPGG